MQVKNEESVDSSNCRESYETAQINQAIVSHRAFQLGHVARIGVRCDQWTNASEPGLWIAV